MNSINQLSQQLTQLSDSLKATNTLITRLSKLHLQPGSEPLDDSTDQHTVRIELAQDIHDSLKQLDEDLDLLKQDIDDLTYPTSSGGRRRDTEQDRERARLQAQGARVGEDLKTSRSHFRRAQLNAKRAAEVAKQKERELVFANLTKPPRTEDGRESGTTTPDLFAGRRMKPAQQKQLTKEELEVDASSRVTSSLRRTHDLLSTELSRSRFAQETFDESTQALADLGESYSGLENILKNSGSLLSTLVHSQKSDTWYLETAFYLLCATLLWLIFRRILLGPFIRVPAFLLKWFVFKPLVGFLYATGVITSEPANRRSVTSSSRTPLIVQNSATGGPPRFSDEMAEEMDRRGGIPVGAGGAQARVGKGEARAEGRLQGERIEGIGKMAEESSKTAREGDDGKERRGDGTVLEERGDVPRNPKKKVFEAEVEDGKEGEGGKRDEL